MTEGRSRAQEIYSRIRSSVDLALTQKERDYDIDHLWAARKVNRPELFNTGIVTPDGKKVTIGMRETRGEIGKQIFTLGYFVNNDDRPTAIGFFFAERTSSGKSFFSNVMNKGDIADLKSDVVFKSVYDLARGSDTIFVEDKYRKLGLGRKFIEVMLDVGEKTKTPDLVLNNVSGYVHRLIDSMTNAGRITSRWIESSGTLVVKRK